MSMFTTVGSLLSWILFDGASKLTYLEKLTISFGFWPALISNLLTALSALSTLGPLRKSAKSGPISKSDCQGTIKTFLLRHVQDFLRSQLEKQKK